MSRTRAWRRYKNFIKAKRKRRIDLEISWYSSLQIGIFSNETYGLYNNLHQYSKNKIHCSCAMCSAKTRNKGHRRYLKGNYAPSINYNLKDRKQRDAMDYDIKEFKGV